MKIRFYKAIYQTPKLMIFSIQIYIDCFKQIFFQLTLYKKLFTFKANLEDDDISCVTTRLNSFLINIIELISFRKKKINERKPS